MSERFAAAATRAAAIAGNYLTFMAALGLVVIWAVSGPFFGFSATWQLVINTGTTIVTFLMVFLIQNSQNRESIALHLKIDELIRAIEGADDALITAEEVSESDLQAMKAQYHKLADDAIEQIEHDIDASGVSKSAGAGVTVGVASAQVVQHAAGDDDSATSVRVTRQKVATRVETGERDAE